MTTKRDIIRRKLADALFAAFTRPEPTATQHADYIFHQIIGTIAIRDDAGLVASLVADQLQRWSWNHAMRAMIDGNQEVKRRFAQQAYEREQPESD